jgi:hypothetical protein
MPHDLIRVPATFQIMLHGSIPRSGIEFAAARDDVANIRVAAADPF